MKIAVLMGGMVAAVGGLNSLPGKELAEAGYVVRARGRVVTVPRTGERPALAGAA